MRYNPTPLDTSRIELDADIEALTDRLAENTHDVWARGRIQEGWTYGPKRDDSLKQHPGLVPYANLTDSEKEYDRRSAMETIKAILAMGYQIRKPPV